MISKISTMIHYPQHDRVRSPSPSGMQSTWTRRTHGGGASPEDLHALARANGFVATFEDFSGKSSVRFSSVEFEGELAVDRVEKGVPWMAISDLVGKGPGSSDAARVKTLLEKTSRSCLVLNSVKTEKTFAFLVT
jgi:organic hydroperoxide reductase OsmC/OhrA